MMYCGKIDPEKPDGHCDQPATTGSDFCWHHRVEHLKDRVAFLVDQNEKQKSELAKAHQHILWLQDGWNEIRNFLSWVKHEPETEEMDEEIDLSELDDQIALELRDYTENFAMTYFQIWYSKINKDQNLNHLDDYEAFKAKEIP